MNNSKKEIGLIIFALLWVMCLPFIFFMINPDTKKMTAPRAQVVSQAMTTSPTKYISLEPKTLSIETLQLMEPTFGNKETLEAGTIFAILYLMTLFVIFLRISELYSLRQLNIQEEG